MDSTQPPPPPERCPACGWYVPGQGSEPGSFVVCPRCALPLTGDLVAEVRGIDAALAGLDAERGRLLGRRVQLLAAARPAPMPMPVTAGWGPVAARETSPRTAQNLLLSLGGVLLAVAAIAFTVVSWGHLGIGGRAVVLGALTAAVVSVPALLVRRALNATGEVVACVGLVLLLLDAYAIRRAALPGVDGPRYAAVSIALVSAAWAVYGQLPLVRRLALPAPAALLLAQLPLPTLAVAYGSPYEVSAALVVTAALDAAVGARALRVTAAVVGAVTGLAGLLVALVLSVDAGDFGGAARAAGLLLAGAAVAAAVCSPRAFRAPGWAVTLLSAVAGLAGVAAFGGIVRVAVGDDWTVPGYLLCAAGLLGAVAVAYVRDALPRAMAGGLGIATGVFHGLALLWALPGLAVGVFTGQWFGPAPAVVVPVVLALVLLIPAPVPVPTARLGALALGAIAAAVLPSALGLPFAVAVLLRVAVVAVLLLVPGRTSLGCAVVLAVTAVAWGLATWPVTFAVLGILLVAFAATAVVRTAPEARAVGGAAAVACAAGLGWAAPAAARWPAYGASLVVLGVAAGAVGLAFALRAPALEYAGYAAAGLAIALALAAGDAAVSALVLALAGVLAAAVALRADRRPLAGYVAVVLMVAASWVRLAASDVTVPEAYALPVSVAALGVGFLRRRRDASASSWAAYAPGLAATLVPSLLATWTDSAWPRPLLLGCGALAVTLLGARHRLQAPLLLGGAALALDALHELAPLVAQVVGALPRWLPLALAGVLLLAVGATYEQRLRDVRRVRDLLGRLR
ncbi:SCO7613 C-terminal domain-containing membrane protein [Streptomyces sp. NPDC059373]